MIARSSVLYKKCIHVRCVSMCLLVWWQLAHKLTLIVANTATFLQRPIRHVTQWPSEPCRAYGHEFCHIAQTLLFSLSPVDYCWVNRLFSWPRLPPCNADVTYAQSYHIYRSRKNVAYLGVVQAACYHPHLSANAPLTRLVKWRLW